MWQKVFKSTNNFNVDNFLKENFEDKMNERGWEVLRETLHRIKAQLGVQFVLVEDDYIDSDYQSEFSAYYSRSFRRYKQRCQRLHFFSDAPSDVKDFDTYAALVYFGFIVLRPTDLHPIGRTIISPLLSDTHREFVTCITETHAHLLGRRFSVSAMPFIQQDTQVGSCAHACLWMLARYMSEKFGYRKFYPAEINALAKAKIPLGRNYPAERGLTVDQMLDALNGMGFAAILYERESIAEEALTPALDKCLDKFAEEAALTPNLDKCLDKNERKQSAKLADIAYRYIESGLPVIIATENHAMIGVGHSYDPNIKARSALRRIPEFIIHDDASGPYRRLPLWDGAFELVTEIIVISPSEATLAGEIAEKSALESIEALLSERQPETKSVGELYQELHSDLNLQYEELEYRTYLLPSTTFQQEILDAVGSGDFDKRTGELILSLDYPRYVWITEVSAPDLLCKKEKKERKCLGRVIVDSTAPAHTSPVILVHAFDIIQVFDRLEDRPVPPKNFIFGASTPFLHRLSPN